MDECGCISEIHTKNLYYVPRDSKIGIEKKWILFSIFFPYGNINLFLRSRYYAPALGFLMFAVGVNSSEKDFLEAFKRPAAILAGYTGQFLVKPILGYVFGTIAVAIFGLPTPVGKNIHHASLSKH